MTPDSFEEARCLSRIQVKPVKRFLLPENLPSKTQQPRSLAKQPLTPEEPCACRQVLAPRCQCGPGDQGTRARNLPPHELEWYGRRHPDKTAGFTCSAIMRSRYTFPSCRSCLPANPQLSRQQGLFWENNDLFRLRCEIS